MLLKLILRHSKPYKWWIAAVLFFQLATTIATLYLPSLNARIIDTGVVKGDTDFIWRTGGVMLAVAFVQVFTAIAAVYFGARTAMAIGRDMRHAVFNAVTGFSAQDVNKFGAATLITRGTNDVQQVQMLVLMSCTLMVMAPIMMVGGIVAAIREDLGLSWLLAVVVPALFLSVGLVVSQLSLIHI